MEFGLHTIVTKFILHGLIPGLKWPGIDVFVENGSLLIITFAILTTIILTTTAQKRVNIYNGSAGLLLIFTTFVYIRCVGLNGQPVNYLLGTSPFLLSK